MDDMHFSWIIPGVLAGSRGPRTVRDLLQLKDEGVEAILRLEQHTISGEEGGLVDMGEYVPDFQAPTAAQTDRILAFIRQQIQNKAPVVVSCRAGMGRTGTVLACYLVSTGDSARDALERVRRLRPGSVEDPSQEAGVYWYEARLRGTSASPSP